MRTKLFIASTLLFLVSSASVAQVPVIDTWKYTLRRPAKGWEQAEYDDSQWKEGSGGFGTRGTPGARVGTDWTGRNIWLRKSFELSAIPESPALLIHHDEDAEVNINGQLVSSFKGWVTEYKIARLDKEGRDALRVGKNVLAVHCSQTGGGQFIDVHVIDEKKPPKLPRPLRSTKPFISELITPWGEKVTAQNAWTEYPRPQLERESWKNLNGMWSYAITPVEQQAAPDKWDGEILVPFALESKLGGVQRLLDMSETLWYRRTFDAAPAAGQRTLLNFEAVDYRCKVFVNGKLAGEHQGGHTPFALDITDAVKPGENELVVRVEDETEGWQLRGKQVLDARGIWYTQVSGIWQTVWMEQVPASYIEDLKISTDAERGTISLRPIVANAVAGQQVRLMVKDGDQTVAKTEGKAPALEVTIDEPKLWSPDSPYLYSLQVALLDEQGNVVDEVESYAGIRTVGKQRDEDGHLRFTLNGKVLFHLGPLDQGWWPDGLLTPPSDEAMLFDIKFLKSAGFNMIRKHIKVEPRRYYYHCDQVGMMLWQDQVSAGHNPPWTRLQPNPRDADWPDEYHQQYMLELERMINELENHPSIVVWVPFNEAWGQHRTVEVGKWVKQRDPSRLVNIASGGNFWPVGDIVDAHKYPHPGFPFEPDRYDDFVKVVGEFGGHGYPVPGHLWDVNRRNWGYGGLPQNKQEYKERYATSLKMLRELKTQGIAGGVYTQTTDVEGEINGLMTYDRKVIKIPAEELARLNRTLYDQPDDAAADAGELPGRPQSLAQSHQRSLQVVVDLEQVKAGLASHDRCLYIKTGWIRDPYIVLGPDGYFYLTGTTPLDEDPRQKSDPFNTGLKRTSIVGWKMKVSRSTDLMHWEELGRPYSLKDGIWFQEQPKRFQEVPVSQWRLWAPELHWLGERWAIVHTSPSPVAGANLVLTKGLEIAPPYENPMGASIGKRHDPSLFQDDDGTWWMIWGATQIAPLTRDFTGFASDPVQIGPSGDTSKMGHEGCLMRKIGDKYVLFGTGWSTGQMRKGSYNLYYATADKITGPYSERNFAGRFLGHGTPFQDKEGRWWCTAFYNANVPPLPLTGIQERDLSETAQTINQQGVTIVPMDIRVLKDGKILVRAEDPHYAAPGPDEAQKFVGFELPQP